MATSDPVLDHRYNDDLLAQQKDQEYIRAVFPDLLHVLDCPELRVEFKSYNAMANKAKSRVHLLGLLAIGLAAIALLSSAATPILNGILEIKGLESQVIDQVTAVKSYSIWSEIAGLVGAAIAIGGLWISGYKKRWLEGRLMTERLRSWHFQTLIYRAKEIEESCLTTDPKAVQAFQEKRALWFTKFLHEHEQSLDSLLHEFIESPEVCYSLLHDEASKYSTSSPILDRVLEAYKALRFKHQLNYTAHKLQKSTSQPLWKPHRWPTNVLRDRLRSISTTCIFAALGVSAYTVISHFARLHIPLKERMDSKRKCVTIPIECAP